MTYRFSDSTYDYRVGTDPFRASPLGRGADGAERVLFGDVAEAHRLLDAAGRHRPAADPLRRLLYDVEPLIQAHRLTDGEVADRVARHLAAGRLRAWRTRAPVWGRADVGGPLQAPPADDAPLRDVTPPAPAEAVPEVPDELPSCRQAWAEINAEAASVLAHGGDADPIERNRHITAAYARYYQRTQAAGVDNPWGGIAAIVSRQAGCSMAYADEMISKGATLDEGADGVPWHRPLLPPGSVPLPLRGVLEGMGLGYQEVGELVKEALADTNKYIFEDIYPVLRMHEDHGMEGIERCGPVRPGPSGPVADRMKEALRLINQGGDENIRQAGAYMARYEQKTIVQDKILSDFRTRKAFEANQWAAGYEWGRDLGARKPELALTAECPPYSAGTEAVPFRGSFIETRNRVRYYQDLARAFGRMPAADKARTLGTLARRGL